MKIRGKLQKLVGKTVSAVEQNKIRFRLIFSDGSNLVVEWPAGKGGKK